MAVRADTAAGLLSMTRARGPQRRGTRCQPIPPSNTRRSRHSDSSSKEGPARPTQPWPPRPWHRRGTHRPAGFRRRGVRPVSCGTGMAPAGRSSFLASSGVGRNRQSGAIGSRARSRHARRVADRSVAEAPATRRTTGIGPRRRRNGSAHHDSRAGGRGRLTRHSRGRRRSLWGSRPQSRDFGLGRGKVFPAYKAKSLLNPARRLVQSPGRTVAAMGLTADARVLEVGSGPGFFSPSIAAAMPEGQLVLVDLQAEMLVFARARLGHD